MRLGGRIAGAIEVLADIETRRRPVADALKDWGLAHRFAGSGDRAAIGNIVYDALRMRLSHAWLMDDESPAALAYAVLIRQWGFTPEALQTEFTDDRFAPPASDRCEPFVARLPQSRGRAPACAGRHTRLDPAVLRSQFRRGLAR
jgi:16S rRNA (cytosine967-C5)-methyltransferase